MGELQLPPESGVVPDLKHGVSDAEVGSEFADDDFEPEINDDEDEED